MTVENGGPDQDVYRRTERGGWGRGSAWRWILLALGVWIARALVMTAQGNDDAGPLLAAIAGALLAVGVVRAVMDWLVTNFSQRARHDDA